MKATKKAITIEAWRIGVPMDEPLGDTHDWVPPSVADRIHLLADGTFEVPTKEGKMTGKAGDYLIRGVEGELYPCDAAIFRKTYDFAGPKPQPRQLTAHLVEGDKAGQLAITVIDEPGAGGAHHAYLVTGALALESNLSLDALTAAQDKSTGRTGMPILFQNGPLGEAGPNGTTHEALLAVIIDRLECFQRGRFACEDNADALRHLKMAMESLQQRTVRRIARGVEGTHRV